MLCLFADFTELVLRDARQQGAVNVYGAAAYGRERVLEDIAQFPPENSLVLLVNMKTCRKRYASLLQTLWDKADLSLPVPSDLPSVFEALGNLPKTVFVLFEHFDAIMETTELDKEYGDSFLEQLNSAKNKGKLKFIFATEQKYDRANFYLGENKQFATPSHLDIPTGQMLKKTHFGSVQIDIALQNNDIQLSKKDSQSLFHFILNHSAPYLFLKFILVDLKVFKMQKQTLDTCLKEWDILFADEQRKSLEKRVNEATSNVVKVNTFTEQQAEKVKPVVTTWLPRLNFLTSYLCKRFNLFCPKE